MVLASHGENFGVALVEAMSCSKPVLTTLGNNITFSERLLYGAPPPDGKGNKPEWF